MNTPKETVPIETKVITVPTQTHGDAIDLLVNSLRRHAGYQVPNPPAEEGIGVVSHFYQSSRDVAVITEPSAWAGIAPKAVEIERLPDGTYQLARFKDFPSGQTLDTLDLNQ